MLIDVQLSITQEAVSGLGYSSKPIPKFNQSATIDLRIPKSVLTGISTGLTSVSVGLDVLLASPFLKDSGLGSVLRDLSHTPDDEKVYYFLMGQQVSIKDIVLQNEVAFEFSQKIPHKVFALSNNATFKNRFVLKFSRTRIPRIRVKV